MCRAESNSQYSRRYRSLLGFANQNDTKKFLGAKDLVAPISFKYADTLVQRIRDITSKYSEVLQHALTPDNFEDFARDKIDTPYSLIKSNSLLPRMNNQGRRPESVLFSWLRGYATAEYFIPSISHILGGQEFAAIGEDDFTSFETFHRAPTADYSTLINGRKVHLEIQSGFQKISDIKQHKVLEAKRIYQDCDIPSICIHIDLFNGQCAFVRLDTIPDSDVNWVTRQQMEGQTVFSIDQNDFKWRLADRIPSFDDLELSL